jgi:peptidoglycan/LPS O-acetylase OafA/YrhL
VFLLINLSFGVFVGSSGLISGTVASVCGAANFLFCFDPATSYFASSSERQPLLHLWSLGVEEQFYIIWPCLIAYLVGTKFVFAFVVGTSFASFMLAHVVQPNFPAFSYFMLPTRLGEFLIGSALTLYNTEEVPSRVKHFFGVVGGVLIGVSPFVVSETVRFPGLLSLLPTGGVVFVLFSGSSSFVSSFFASKYVPLRGLGTISYSLYLYHWPVIVYCRELGFDQNLLFINKWLRWSFFMSVSLMLGLGSWFYTENVFAEPQGALERKAFSRRVIVFGILSVVFVCAVSAGFSWSTSFRAQKPIAASSLTISASTSSFKRIQVTHLSFSDEVSFSPNNCVLGRSSCIGGAFVTHPTPRMLIFGDSLSPAFFAMFDRFALACNVSFLGIYHQGCAPFIPYDKNFSRTDCFAHECRTCTLFREHLFPLLPTFDVIVACGTFASYSVKNLTAGFSRFLSRYPEKRIIVVSGTPQFQYDHLNCPKQLSPFIDYHEKSDFMTNCWRELSRKQWKNSLLGVANSVMQREVEEIPGATFWNADNYFFENGRFLLYSPWGRRIGRSRSYVTQLCRIARAENCSRQWWRPSRTEACVACVAEQKLINHKS